MSFKKSNLEVYSETSFTDTSNTKKRSQCEITLNQKNITPGKGKKVEGTEKNVYRSLVRLFNYADSIDNWLMVAGSLAAIINGISLPVGAIIMGRITDIFTNVTLHGFQMDNKTTYEDYDNFSLVENDNNTFVGSDREEFFDYMVTVSITYFCVSFATLAMIAIQVFCWEMAAERQIHKLRKVFFSQILRQDCSWYDLNKDGDISQKLSDDIDRIREGIGCKISFLMAYLSTFFFGIGVGFLANTQLTLLLLILAPVIIAVQSICAKIVHGSSAREQLRYGIAGGIANEVLSCIKLVLSFSGEVKELNRYKEALEEGSRQATKKYYSVSLLIFIWCLTSYITFAVAFRYSAYLIEIGNATPGEVFTVFFSVMAGSFTIGNALPYVNVVFTAFGSASTIFSIIDRVPNIDPYSTSGICIENLNGVIDFESVDFFYPTRPQVRVLRGLTMRIEAGKKVAVVGPSGSGKSTLVNLILRFYDPPAGKVTLDGINVAELNLAWLRGSVGLVSQEPVLFGVSISENIRYGRDHVTTEDIINASKIANAHSFIEQLPQGYDTEVGSRGTMLSGGQKQRIAIARALIRDPKILLLDEATSALDTESESAVQEALERAMNGRTTVIIAHRLSTIRNADLIVTMKDGKVHESGTHEELMALRGLYFSLVSMQQKTLDLEEQEEELPEEEEEKPKPILFQNDERKKSVIDLFKRKLTMRSRKSSGNSITLNSVTDEKAKEQMKGLSFNNFVVLLSGYYWLLILALVSNIIIGILMPLNASFYADIFNIYMLTGNKYEEAVSFWTYIFVAVAIVVGIANYVQIICFSILTEKIIIRLRESAFRSLLSQQVGWFDHPDHTPGKLIASLSRDPPRIKSAAGFRAGQVIVALTVVFTALIISFTTFWKLAAILSSVLPVIFFVNHREIQLIKKHQERDSKLMDAAGQVSSESMNSLTTVQALGKEKLFLERYCNHLELPFREGRHQAILYALVYGITQALVYVVNAVSFLSGGYFLVHDQTLEPSQIFRIFFAWSFCLTFVGQAVSYIQEFYKAKTSISFINGVIEQYSEDGSLSDSGLKPLELKGNVQFVNVEFHYPSRKKVKILRGLNLKISQGTTVALVGKSGCGKSTVMSLLQSFYSPTKGKILIDDVNIAEINLKWLRQHLGVVTQEPVLLATSIRENIAYGALNPDNVSMDEIIDAAKVANIHQFIATLPKGYDTEVGDMGAQLSGGQKQRIAIARAMIRNPKILLLDEATSALDTESEKIVQDALDKARAGRTCIVIAHRLSTIRNADLIAVIQQGRVTELGTHVQLTQSSGFYSQLVGHSFK